jgi:Fe-S cluster biosynthesis and repair protein YggX
MRIIKLNQEEANNMYDTFKSIMFNRIKSLVEKYCPKYLKDLKMGEGSEYITCGCAFVEPTTMMIKTISGQREIAGWAVGYYDAEFGDATYVEEGSNAWAAVAREFVMMLIEDDMNQLENYFFDVNLKSYLRGEERIL